MAIDFPNGPLTVGQTFTDVTSGRSWQWNGSQWIAVSAQIVESGIANNAVTLSKMADNSVGANQIINSSITSSELNVASSGTTGQYLTRNTGVTSGIEWTSGFLMPPGSITQYAGTNEPSGWLFCNGSPVNRTTYASLFATFGTTFTSATVTNNNTTVSGLTGMSSATHLGWGIAGTNIPSGATIVTVNSASSVTISANATGSVSGSATIVISPYGFTGANNVGNDATFNLPNFKGRTPVGMYSDEPSYDVSTQPTFDNANDPFTRLGLTGGVKRHVLTEAQMPLHSHNPKFHTTATEITYGFYSPPANTTHWIFEGTAGGPFGGRVLVSAVSGRNIPSQYNGVYPSMVENAGSGTRHQNLQPFVVVNYIIKT